MSYLEKILDFKRMELERSKRTTPYAELTLRARTAPPCRGFKQALHVAKDIALIAEIKAASPSQGPICPNLDPVQVAKDYESAGASCLSVLTDQEFFQGSSENLIAARAAVSIPVLRKDFIIDDFQIYESRVMGADAILLIAAALQDEEITHFRNLAMELGMDVMVEVHGAAEADRALALGCDLIGVNNRNLFTFETALAVSEELLPKIAPHALGVSESSISSRADIDRVRAAGAKAVLIGTSFCSSPNIQEKVKEVMGW